MRKTLDRFRQLEGPRRQAAPESAPSHTSGRFDAVLGPGERPPVALDRDDGPAAPAPAASDPTPPDLPAPELDRPAPPPAADVPLESQARMSASRAELEELVAAELNQRPMHAGQQIAIWRAIMRRSVDQIDRGHGLRAGAPIGVAVLLALFLLGSLMVAGPRLWHLLLGAGVVLLLVPWRRR
jgi:hypothetical protein